MSSESNPAIGDWYKSTSGDTFEIVATDDDDDTLELQYYDGTVEELDQEIWDSLHAEPIEPPEDWTGSMDVSREDQCEQPEICIEPGNWMNKIDRMIDPEIG